MVAPGYRQSPPRRESKKWLVAAIVAAVVVIIVIVAFFMLAPIKLGIDVSDVQWSGSNSCGGLPGQTTPGFIGPDGGTLSNSLKVTNTDPSMSCSINSISATTSGFSVVGSNLPLEISAGGSATLTFTINLPSSDYTGPLELVVS